MQLQQSYLRLPQEGFAPAPHIWKRDSFATPTPRQNHLLAALPADVLQRLLPELELVPLPPGWTIYGPGERQKYAYFITAGIVSRFCMMASGESAETAIIGNEGVLGMASVLGGESTTGWCLVLSGGHAFRLRAEVLRREFEHDGPLPRQLLRYTQALFAQTGQIVVCNRHHSLEQRLCRWLLTCQDRMSSSQLAVTQELIAEMLGVRREGVTEAAGGLQGAGLIHYSRGHVAVLDRPGLEARACECYAVLKQLRERLPARRIGFGESGERGVCHHGHRDHALPQLT